jgi:ArsR family transcriptional regulator
MEQPMIRDVCDVQSVNQVQVRRVQKQMPDATTLHQVADIFATLGDPTRARIVFALSQSELCVCDLAVLLNMTLSAVSHQLRILRHMGLVKFRKMGRMAYYSLDDEHASELLAQALEHVEHSIQEQVRRVRK